MDLSRPKRMMRPRAAARRMAQVSVDRLREGRVLGVAMVASPGMREWNESAMHTKKCVGCGCNEFFREAYGAGGTSYNNSVSA
jgi:hypothetical protein